MPDNAIALWLANLALDTTGQMAFKAAASRSAPGAAGWRSLVADPLIGFGIGCYVVEFVTWLAFLTLVPLSVAVLLASVNIVTVMVGGRLLFHEATGTLRTGGIVLIAAGVAMVGWGAT